VSQVYSRTRLRIVLLLLTALALPFVAGTVGLVYYYLKFARIVEQRLSGERWLVPSRLYSRPLQLRGGMPMPQARFVKILNGLKYEQRGGTVAAGQFSIRDRAVVFQPRPGPDAADEPIVVRFDKDRIQELRGEKTKRPYTSQTLEPELVTYLYDESREKRRFIKYEELPDHLVKAVLAIEDRRFFSHPGLDPLRIVGAAIKNVRAESYIQGGSTITQQLVKNFFLTPERTIRRKAQEAMIAFILERSAAKQEILELYLNEIYLGQLGSFSINGVGEAARMYFHKDVANISLPEAALLAGMIQSPNPYNPQRHPKRATERRNVVLRAMQDAGFIDDKTCAEAIGEPLKIEEGKSEEAPYFVDLVKTQLKERGKRADRYQSLTTENLSIYTSLDLNLQAIAQEALQAGLEQVDKLVKRKDHPPAQGALIALEPKTGAVVALVGGRSYGASQYNRATTAKRQPGSTFKPFVYLTAFEATFDDPSLPPITLATVVDDVPAVFFYENKEYIPENYEGEYGGRVTLRRALSRSHNVATVKVAEMVGFNRIADLWSKRLKVNENVKPYPAVALGSFEVTPLEMATAYNILANGGLKVDPVTVLRVTDQQGKTIERDRVKELQRPVHEESVFLVTSMMQSVFTEGTAAGARGMGFTLEAAGKTGTTNDMRDAWFAGFTPDLLCVVWVGFDDNSPLNLSGGRAALPIWVEFMKNALEGIEPTPFEVPSQNIVFFEIDKQNGLLANPNCPKTANEAFIAGTQPHERCRMH
jgi:penicillin-binding protein 1B